MAEHDYFAVGSDNTITLIDLEDADGNLIMSASVVGTLKYGNVVVENGEVIFESDGAPGRFVGVLQNTADMIPSRVYKLEIAIDTGPSEYMIAITRPAQHAEA